MKKKDKLSWWLMFGCSIGIAIAVGASIYVHSLALTWVGITLLFIFGFTLCFHMISVNFPEKPN